MILISHADPAFRQALGVPLVSRGCVVRHAATGVAAWAMMRLQEFHLVVLDLQLPDVGGLELLRLMRGLTWNPCVVLVMGAAFSGIEKIALSLGADTCCREPEALDSVVRSLGATSRRGIFRAISLLDECTPSVGNAAPPSNQERVPE